VLSFSYMSTIKKIQGYEILDSRGNPTVQVSVLLDDGSIGEASVPSGASTGTHEALELRDGDESRYQGKGVQKAVENVNNAINEALQGMEAENQNDVDKKMLDVDGTPNKSKLGANAILGTSMAVARAAAISAKLPLYEYLRRLAGIQSDEYVIPTPMMNVVNGGKHADSGLDLQEFMVMPVGASSFKEALRYGSEIFHALASLLKKSGHSIGVGDEGGFAPHLQRNDEVFSFLTKALQSSGYEPGKQVVFGVDAAASEFYDKNENAYVLMAPSVKLSREQLLSLFKEWAKTYPIKTLEDPLFEDDWEGWTAGTEKLRTDGVQIVGDDFFVTNVERLRKGIEQKAATAILVKVNQIGSLSETLQTIKLAQENDYGVIISHRSGETADTFIADLSVAANSGQIKTGSLSRSERVEKYNRLLRIESELGEKAVYKGLDSLRH